MTLWRSPRLWNITGRLMLVAILPVLVLSITFASQLYLAEKDDAARSVRAIGAPITQALAVTSQYALVSGNTEGLAHAVRQLLASTPAVASIEILDSKHGVVFSVTGTDGPAEPGLSFSEPVNSDDPDAESFDSRTPHASISIDRQSQPQFRSGVCIGFIRVGMTSKALLATQRERWLWLAGKMAVCVVLSALLGLYLAKNIRTPLLEVVGALREIRQGRLDVRFDAPASGELGELQSAIEEMARSLASHREVLEREVATRTTELQAAIAAADEVDAERRRLLAHSADLVEEERWNISNDLHDQFGASLVAVRLRAAALLTQGGVAPTQAEIEDIARAITAAVNQLYGDSREMVKRLRPEVLDTLGLAGAVKESTRSFNANRSGCELLLELDETLPRVHDRVAIVAYRAIQEALSNIAKHAHATKAKLVIQFNEKESSIHIVISDNGMGFDTGRRQVGFGLIGMRERVRAVEGDICIHSDAGAGTRLELNIPAWP